MFHSTHLIHVIRATAIALAFSVPSLHAQTSATGTDTTNNKSQGILKSDNKSATASNNKTENKQGQANDAVREMMEDIAHANLAEIEVGKMALEKSQNEQIKAFAQKLIDDHTNAMEELQKIAQTKGIDLPKETDLQHKTIATALQALSGDTFDEQFIKRVGVGDHQRTLQLLQKTQKNTKDPELKAYAAKTAKVVQGHLNTAKALNKKK